MRRRCELRSRQKVARRRWATWMRCCRVCPSWYLIFLTGRCRCLTGRPWSRGFMLSFAPETSSFRLRLGLYRAGASSARISTRPVDIWLQYLTAGIQRWNVPILPRIYLRGSVYLPMAVCLPNRYKLYMRRSRPIACVRPNPFTLGCSGTHVQGCGAIVR